jgi:hypothetical protein
MSADIARRIVSLRRRKVALEADMRAVQAELDELCPRLLDYFAEAGMDRGTWDGMTLSQRRELWASVPAGADVRKIKAILRRAGIDPTSIFKEKANGQTLSAAVREFDASESGVPEKLRALLNISEVYKVGFTDNGTTAAKRAA